MSEGYGRTVYCYGAGGLQPGRALTGRAALAASIWRRLTTRRGSLQGGAEELAFGYDIRQVIGAPGDRTSVARLATIVESEVAKDERVAAVAAEVSSVRDEAGSIAATLRVSIVPADESESFALTLDVTALDVQILGGLPS